MRHAIGRLLACTFAGAAIILYAFSTDDESTNELSYGQVFLACHRASSFFVQR